MRTKYLAIFLAFTIGCETYGIFPIEDEDAGADPTQDAGARPDGGDAGPPVQRSLSYEPAGCGYTVRTPEVTAARPSADVFAEPDALDMIHVGWAGPAHTTFAVNWRSSVGTLASRVLYGTERAAVEGADGAGAGVLEQLGHSMDYGRRADRTQTHEVHVCGLTPSTTYYYKAGGPGHWSPVFETRTAPAPGSTEPFSFGITGDSRNNEENAWPISQRRLAEAAIDFEIFTGDAVFVGINQGEWVSWFGAQDGAFTVQDLLSEIPILLVNGNHDGLALNYFTQFTFPQEETPGEQGQGEEWYSFDYGNAHFVMLNDSTTDTVLGDIEANWLRQDLMRVDRARTPWVFAVHHRPFYTCRSNHEPLIAARTAWQPIFDEFAVDFVLTGHNHVYERSQPIRGLQSGEAVLAPTAANGAPTYAAGEPTGTVYTVIAGAGADLYEVSTDCATSFTGQAVRPYAVVSIDDRTLRYQVFNILNGAMIDELMLTK